MLKVLIKKQLTEVFKSYFVNTKKNKARSKGATVGFFILFAAVMVGVLGSIFTGLSNALCGGLAGANLDWLYYLIMTGIAVFLGVFGSVFNTYAGLYTAKDNDLLLAMPIPVGTLVASRLFNVYILGTAYSAMAFLPAWIVYLLSAGVSFASLAGGLLMFFETTLIVFILSCILGYGVAQISLKLKNKSYVTAFVSLLFIAAYYFVYYRANAVISNILQNAALYGNKIKGSAYVLYLWGTGATGNPLSLFGSLAVCLVLLAVTWQVINRSFMKVAAATGTVAKTQYKTKSLREHSSTGALLRKEFCRFTGSANYMLNCGLGVLFIPALGIFVLVKGSTFMAELQKIFPDMGSAAVLFAAILCMVSSLNHPSAHSVSLEGKNLWQLKVLPVTGWQALQAKLQLHLLITLPPVLFAGGCLFAMPYGLAEKILTLALGCAYTVFCAALGLLMDLKMPNLTWTDEIKPIKQSTVAFIATFMGWIFAGALAGLYLSPVGTLVPPAIYLGTFTVLTLAADGILCRWLKTKGAVLLENL